MLDRARNVSETTKKEKKYDQNGQRIHRKRIRASYTALTEDDMDNARRTMKRLEAIAMQDYGFDYADELAMKKEACKK